MGTARPRYISGADAGTPGQLEAAARHAVGLLDPNDIKLLITIATKDVLGRVAPKLRPILRVDLMTLWDKRDNQSSPLRIIADRDFAPFTWDGVVLLIYPNTKTLSRVGEIGKVTAEVVVPWIDNDDIKEWKLAWSPTPISGAQSTSTAIHLTPTVKAALHSLTTFINVGTGLVNPIDRHEAVHVLETLLAFEPGLDRTAVRAWLVSKCGWAGDAADEAEKILKDLAADKKIHGRKGADAARYEWWKKEAAKAGSAVE